VNIISRSQYPAITSLDYANFVHKAGMIDKNLNSAGMDMAFIATNVKRRDIVMNDQESTNVGNALCRFEFLEVIVRLAK
jgi:hypothetical protein